MTKCCIWLHTVYDYIKYMTVYDWCYIYSMWLMLYVWLSWFMTNDIFDLLVYVTYSYDNIDSIYVSTCMMSQYVRLIVYATF